MGFQKTFRPGLAKFKTLSVLLFPWEGKDVGRTEKGGGAGPEDPGRFVASHLSLPLKQRITTFLLM